jgi:hypothetical protein
MRGVALAFLVIVVLLVGNPLSAFPGDGGMGSFGVHGIGGFGIGIYMGVPWWGPVGWWVSWFPAMENLSATPEFSPPVYLQAGVAPPSPPASYWYYCLNPQGYYPSVTGCAGGWITSVAQAVPVPR